MKKSLILLFILVAQLSALELPSPPTGFSWQECNEIKGAFLKPQNWHFKKVIKESSMAYFITKENIDKAGMFETGMSLNVIKNIDKKMNMTPTMYAVEFAKAAKNQHTFLDTWSRNMGPFKSIGFVYKKDDFIFHKLLISNDKTGTLYLFIFEAHSKNWDQARILGNEMLKKLFIDDSV